MLAMRISSGLLIFIYLNIVKGHLSYIPPHVLLPDIGNVG